MRICILKSNNSVLEMQSEAREGTLINNAVNAGYSADDIEERVITNSEWETIWKPAQIEQYKPNTLIAWAMSQFFTADLIPHMASFLDFANKANDESKANFLTYATAVGLVDTANIIIAKMIELGANITQGGE